MITVGLISPCDPYGPVLRCRREMERCRWVYQGFQVERVLPDLFGSYRGLLGQHGIAVSAEAVAVEENF